MMFSTAVFVTTLAVLASCKHNFMDSFSKAAAADAFYDVCWYEYLKVLPGGNLSQFLHCASTARQTTQQPNGVKFKASLLNALSNNTIPEEYTTACSKFVDNTQTHGEYNMAFWIFVMDTISKEPQPHSSYDDNGIDLLLMRELDPTPFSDPQVRPQLLKPRAKELLETNMKVPNGLIDSIFGNVQQSPLNDGQNGMSHSGIRDTLFNLMSQFPFFWFINCLMNQLQVRHGETMYVKQTTLAHEKWHFNFFNYIGYLIFLRDNEFREAHGVKPFSPKRELVEEAQKWADQMAVECKAYSSDSNTRLYNGEPVGENIAEGDAVLGPAKATLGILTKGFPELENVRPREIDVAYMTSNGWYDEIKNYPFPSAYKVGQELKGDISHFTQTVWNNTEYVGYGYAYNETCNKWFVAARYYPAGNLQSDEQYKANVHAPVNVKSTAELQDMR